MFSPYINYGGYAKSKIPLLIEERRAIGGLLNNTCSWYKGYKGQMHSFHINRALLREKLTELVMSYFKQGLKITSRHAFYRKANENLYPFNKQGYRAVLEILVDLRLEGKLPWDSIADRSRYWYDPIPKSTSLSELIEDFHGTVLSKLGFDPWKELGKYVEIWVEKESIAEFLKPLARKWLTVLAPSRGYASWAYVWEGVKRIKSYGYEEVTILYVGDYDPSGLDIERHLKEAINHFKVNCHVNRVAVTERDIETLPPSPLKKGDPRLKSERYAWYRESYDNKVWEVDAIEPKELYRRVEDALKEQINLKIWRRIQKKTEKIRSKALKILDEALKNAT